MKPSGTATASSSGSILKLRMRMLLLLLVLDRLHLIRLGIGIRIEGLQRLALGLLGHIIVIPTHHAHPKAGMLMLLLLGVLLLLLQMLLLLMLLVELQGRRPLGGAEGGRVRQWGTCAGIAYLGLLLGRLVSIHLGHHAGWLLLHRLAKLVLLVGVLLQKHGQSRFGRLLGHMRRGV